MMMQINPEYIRMRAWKLYSRFVSYALYEGRPLTTSGRWFNYVVFANYRIAKLLPQLKKVTQPVFILGTGRSGTTILGIVMSMHKEVGFLNEPKALWHEVNSHEDIIGSYTMKDASYMLNTSDADEKQKKDIHKIFGAYLFSTASKRVVDKYPELIFRVPYVKALFPDAKFIFLVRNGWDTCASIDNWSVRLASSIENETQDWWGRNNRKWELLVEQVLKQDDYFSNIVDVIDEIDNHRDMAALEWVATMRQGFKILEEYPDDVMRVNYEQLIESPRDILEKLEIFCSFKHDEIYIEYGEEVLKPVNAKAPVKLHSKIMPLFNDMMIALGYMTKTDLEGE